MGFASSQELQVLHSNLANSAWLGLVRAAQVTHRKSPPPVSTASQVIVLCTFFAVVFTLYLTPLTISSPCIMEKRDLGPKPALIGHRGAPMVSAPRGWDWAAAIAGEDPVGNSMSVITEQ